MSNSFFLHPILKYAKKKKKKTTKNQFKSKYILTPGYQMHLRKIKVVPTIYFQQTHSGSFLTFFFFFLSSSQSITVLFTFCYKIFYLFQNQALNPQSFTTFYILLKPLKITNNANNFKISETVLLLTMLQLAQKTIHLARCIIYF